MAGALRSADGCNALQSNAVTLGNTIARDASASPTAEKTPVYWREQWHVSRRIARDDHVLGSRST